MRAGCIRRRPKGSNGFQRPQGGVRGCADKPRPEVREEYTVDSDFTPGGGYEAFVRMTKALARAGLPLPDGVLVGNDQMAIGLLKAAKDLGLRVPGDLALAGIGDIPTAVYVDPPLTTVSLPLKAMGRAAAKSLLTLVKRATRLAARRARRAVDSSCIV